jgi:hypothetical protein
MAMANSKLWSEADGIGVLLDDDGIAHRMHQDTGWFRFCCTGAAILQLDALDIRLGTPTCLDCAQCACT